MDRTTRTTYTVLPSFHDERDHFVVISYQDSTNRRNVENIDLRSFFPVVYKQEEGGSSIVDAVCAVEMYNHLKAGQRVDGPSRDFQQYVSTTLPETDQFSVTGSTIKNALCALATIGVCGESLCDVLKNQQPPNEAYSEAVKRRISQYGRIPQNAESIETTLLAGLPIVVGFLVLSNFEDLETAATGQIALPTGDQEILGGHAAVLVGFDRTDPQNPVFIGRNSWGSEWGDGGYFYIPYDYILHRNLTFDLWTFVNTIYTSADPCVQRFRTPIPNGTLRIVSPQDLFFLQEDDDT